MKRFRREDCGWHLSHGLGKGRGNPPAEQRRVLEACRQVAWVWRCRKSERACSCALYRQLGKHVSWREGAGQPVVPGRAVRKRAGAGGARGENPERAVVAASRSTPGLGVPSGGAVDGRGVSPATSASDGGSVPWGQLGSSAAQKADIELVEKSWKFPGEMRR